MKKINYKRIDTCITICTILILIELAIEIFIVCSAYEQDIISYLQFLLYGLIITIVIFIETIFVAWLQSIDDRRK